MSMKNFKVLLVDDETEFVNTLHERLRLRDLDSEVAYDGEQALQLFKQDEIPDVVILDLKMPGIDGMEVLRRIRKAYSQVQVIMLTGHGTDKDEKEAKELGAFAYLKKPVDLNTLVQTMKAAFKRLEDSMVAAAFAEEGEFSTAKSIMEKGKEGK
jgi:DNA-binding response OmpR family regulator